MPDTNVLFHGTPLPDARLDLWGKRKRTELVQNGQVFELVWCVNCGADGGAVFKGCPVFFLCDECVGKWGPPAGALEVRVNGDLRPL
jgi:hypothetical protein